MLYRSKKFKPIIVDPGLYLSEGTEMFFATQKREYPKAFRLFTGKVFLAMSLESSQLFQFIFFLLKGESILCIRFSVIFS